MKLDAVTVVPFPDSAAFGAMHEKFFEPLVNSLNHAYSFADREDAVEEAFYKLMFKKDRGAYEKEPETEKDWFYSLRWQARAELSHRREHAERHARYVEEAAKALTDVFACGHQGEEMDAGIRSRALIRALKTLRKEQEISRRDLDIYTAIETGEASGRELAARYGLTSDNVYVIKYRVGRRLRKYGPRCFEHALRKEGYVSFMSAA